MKKLRVILMSLSIVAALALAMPTVVLADDDGGPQGTTKSTTPAPPPPPPDMMAIFYALIRVL
jgi:hypothetical protein